MTSKELRCKYIEFFKQKKHQEIPSASLVPENDPSVLFTTAGMHPLVPFLLGEKHPAGKRLVNCQKCIRTGDIELVGDQWHLTFLEMLGNWSLGDYWKRQAIEWSFEFLTSKKWLGIPAEKLAVTVFAGDKDAPFDEESYNIWQSLGIPDERIYKYDKKENWWGPAGATGPCGPDTEMFYISDKEPCGPDCQPSCDCGKYVEMWNDVFLEYNKKADGKYEPLKQKNVDTGMGLERVVAVLNNYQDNYQELFKPIIEKIEELSGKKYPNKISNRTCSGFSADLSASDNANKFAMKRQQVGLEVKSMRIISDHLRAATFIMGDDLGIAPSNVDQGYVARKLIRRAIRHGRQLGIQENFTHKIGEIVIKTMSDIYPELINNKKFVITNFLQEEEKFTKTLQQGIKEFEKITQSTKTQKAQKTQKALSGKAVFDLFQTYGFPLELTKELAEVKGLKVDEKDFEKEFKKHQEKSRTAAAGKFKGGLADGSDQAKKYHTATHLLHAALRQVLGEHVLQKGSNITEKRLRFDFSHPEKMTPEQIQQVEDMVNEIIKKDLPVKVKEMSVDQAKDKGAVGVFAHKYGDKVKVYSVDDYSCEICGGPHVKNTGELGHFKIKKEESSSAGVRRIKAVLE